MRQLLSNFKGYYKGLILGPIFKLTEAVFELFVPLIMAGIIDVGVKNGDVSYVLQHGALLVLLGLMGLGAALTCQYFAAQVGYGFGRNLRDKLFRHVMSLSARETGELGEGSLITRLTNDVTQVQTGVNMFIRLAIRAPFLAIGSIIMAMSINLKISLIFLVTTPLIVAVLYFVMNRSLPYYTKTQEKQDRISRVAGENLEGVRVIRAFSRQRQEREEFAEAGDELADVTIRVGRISALLNPLTNVIVYCGIILIVWVGAKFAFAGEIETGRIIALVSYMNQTLLALIVLANIIVIFSKAIASARRVVEVLDTQPSVVNPVHPREAEDRAQRVVFDHVSFAYSAGREEALSDVSFSVSAGQTVGVIGGTGSGKSTLARLIPRSYDATGGSVRVNGLDVREWDLAALRRRVSPVPQTTTLFSGTIRENLKLGNPAATDEELWRALTVAQGREFVESRPEGLNAPVMEGGKNLSGGQRQRLTIARALAAKPEILILDDSASALDFATDAALRKALKEETSGMTVFMISQRASTIKNADQILVLDDGRLVGAGRHEELLKNCPVYREICVSQKLVEEVAAK